MTTSLTILGASVRAAAHSAIRARLQPSCVDLFADRDLRAVAEAQRVDHESYPDAFEHCLRPGKPWMYVGALENHPALIDRMADVAPLWGNCGEVLNLVRSPFVLRDWMTEEGLLTPETQGSPPEDTTKSWLVKPLASGGGRGIELWRDGGAKTESHVYQSFCAGTPASAVFLGDGSTAMFLGATAQILGTMNSEFEYVGNIGPIPLSDIQNAQVRRMGQVLARRARLIGLFGVDLIIDGERVILIEVNPRYTASVELLEWSQGRSLLGLHCAQFQKGQGTEATRRTPMRGVLGKAILRASETCTFPSAISARHFARAARHFPVLADIPDLGATIARGDPVFTVYARAKTADECRRRLQGRLEMWARRLKDS